MEQNLCNDLATITSVDKKVFDKLVRNSYFCICDYLETASLDNDDIVKIDIGIGTLVIKIGDGVLTYNFKPSTSFETAIVSTIENNQNPLTSVVDAALVNKLNKLYESLL